MFDKIKKMFNKDEEKGSKKQIENLVVLIIVLIITVIAINNIWKNDDSKSDDINETRKFATISEKNSINLEENDNLQDKLENTLSKMAGVENIKVLLNYSETSQVIAMYNENTIDSSTEEKDSSGGVRTITQTDVKKEVVFSDENGTTTPVTEKVIMPKIEGAIIMVKGKNDADTKSKIISAVSAVTGLASHKIQVLSMD